MHFAREFAKAILIKDNKELENAQEENLVDLNIIKPEDGSIKIEQIRLAQNKIIEKPIMANHKIYIIDDSQTMTKEAQNSLLKTLEEPPEYVVIILVCSNDSTILSTIKSRCTNISFKDISESDIKRFIDENPEGNDLNQNFISMSDGSIGKLIELSNNQELYNQVKELFENIEKYDKIDFVKNAELIYKSKDIIEEVLDFLNILILKKAKEDLKYVGCIDIVEKAKKRLKQNANYDMTIDDLCFSLWEEINENNSRSQV